MDLQFAAPSLIEALLALVVVLLFIVVGVLASKINALQASFSNLENDMSSKLSDVAAQANNANNQQSEAQARSLVITRHLQTLEDKQTDIENQVRELKLQDPSLRLYQRAAELVKQGASIDEIIEACDIPRAEAEMLMMVHRQNG